MRQLIGKDSVLTALFVLVIIGGLLGSIAGTYDTFDKLTGSPARAAIIVVTVEIALVMYARWTLIADDQWTRLLTFLLTLLYLAIAGMVQLVNADIHRGVSQEGTLVKWFADNALILPVLTGAIAFLVELFDVAIGKTGGNYKSTWDRMKGQEIHAPSRAMQTYASASVPREFEFEKPKSPPPTAKTEKRGRPPNPPRPITEEEMTGRDRDTAGE